MSDDTFDWAPPAPPEHVKRERNKARELRQGSWWKQQIGQGLCYHCGGKFSKELLTMDHLVPIARGGKSTKQNCVVCCKDCNTKKGRKLNVEMTMEEMRARGELGEGSSGSPSKHIDSESASDPDGEFED